MMKSPMHPSIETSDCSGYEFDPGVNFSEFLKEARQYATEVKPQESCGNSEVKGEERRKKSWRSSLFSWWKTDKKSSKPGTGAADAPRRSYKPKKGYFSGPILGNARVNRKSQRPSSGHVTTVFNPTRKEENEVPYMCLDQPNNSPHVNAYGPLYSVT
ncbi:hypothetical protein SLEP1_g6435 [Rubroshorea leprosula]|uniref:Uncharacterized protein n=1 Tax=Rubroshorea leprosula TaxID=152421 RepID=A0AAV5I4E0_9ROSI|nr:hypothetical protein SLEP1_g6435 [Rubroshorea leprosula]